MLRSQRRPPSTGQDRKSTRLNSSHSQISYAVFCLKKKKKTKNTHPQANTKTKRGLRVAVLEEQQRHLSVGTMPRRSLLSSFFFFFNDTATTEIYTLSLHDALPISSSRLPCLSLTRRTWAGSRP